MKKICIFFMGNNSFLHEEGSSGGAWFVQCLVRDTTVELAVDASLYSCHFSTVGNRALTYSLALA